MVDSKDLIKIISIKFRFEEHNLTNVDIKENNIEAKQIYIIPLMS